MKYKSLNLASRFPVFSGLVLGILLAGCSAGDAVLPDADPDPEPGEPVTLTFDMYSASVTRADAASTSEDMAPSRQEARIWELRWIVKTTLFNLMKRLLQNPASYRQSDPVSWNVRPLSGILQFFYRSAGVG
jgi:hypothetical protein